MSHECAEVARLRKVMQEARDIVTEGPPRDRSEGIVLLIRIDHLLREALKES